MSFLLFIPIALLGWLCGALVNYLTDALPWRRRLTAPFCQKCESAIPFWNYFIWPRRCDSCSWRRSRRTWIVELIFVLIAIGLWALPVGKLGFWGGLFLLTYFGVVVLIDLEFRLILHPVSLFGALAGLGLGIYLHGATLDGVKVTLLGGIAGFGIMWLVYMLGELLLRLIARLRGDKVDDVAFGFGDVNLSGVLGLILGWPGISAGLLLAIFLAGAVSLVYLLLMVILRRYRRYAAIPYGPFLVAGAVILIFFPANLQQLFK